MLRRLITALLVAFFAVGMAASVRAQTVLISEFMASNHATLADEDGDYPDWIELYNPTAAAVSLNGWYLSDNASKLTKWKIPAVSLAPNSYMVVFASGKNRVDPAKPLHTSFKLSAASGFLGLIEPDGTTIASSYAPYPNQQTDVSYGMAFNGTASTLVAAGAAAKAFVPANSSLGNTWTGLSFTNDGTWKSGATGIGYERATGYESLIGLDLGTQMYNLRTTAYIRIPFTITGTPVADALTLRMKYDDGFVAYLNGTRVAAANAPTTLAWNSAATQTNDDSNAVVFQDFDITSFASLLRTGNNILAIQGLNASTSSSDFLILPELDGSVGTGVQPTVLRYFSVPSPGGPNSSAVDMGPVISTTTHTPAALTSGQNLQVTALVTPTSNPVQTVTLTYLVNYGTPVTISMVDDGAHGDGDAGDGVYGATIPASAYASGQMVRWAVTATDSAGSATRYPIYANPAEDAQYDGTMVSDPSVTSALPQLYWWVQNAAAANTEDGTRCSIFFNGNFYDNVMVRERGNTSEGWPKKNYKFDMNSGAYFQYDPAQAPVEEFNLQSTYSDKSYMREVLAWGTYANAQVPGLKAFHMRVQQNGAFFSVAEWVEQPDETMLTRNGLDADGALYKMYNECVNATIADDNVEKKTRTYEGSDDLQALVTGIQNTGTPLTDYLFDNVDVPEMIDYLAATSIVHDNDCESKNYYLYRDSDGNGEWQVLPWDKDLTFGRNFTTNGGVLNDTIWADNDPQSHPFFGDSAHPKIDGPWNRLTDALYREPTIKVMYLRRLRTLMDNLLQPPGLASGSYKYENQIDSLVSLIAPDVQLDRTKWGNPYGDNEDLLTATGIIKSSYLPRRRNHLFITHSTPGDGLIPTAQTGAPGLQFASVEREPVSGNQDEEYIQIYNPTNAGVDISGWTLSGDITHTFHPGTVVPALGSLYVSPDVTVFRKRTSGPSGGQGLFIQGDYHGHLSATGVVQLQTDTGALVTSTSPTMGDVQSALSIAAGLTAATSSDPNRLNVETSGASALVIDMSDAVRIAREVAGLDP